MADVARRWTDQRPWLVDVAIMSPGRQVVSTGLGVIVDLDMRRNTCDVCQLQGYTMKFLTSASWIHSWGVVDLAFMGPSSWCVAMASPMTMSVMVVDLHAVLADGDRTVSGFDLPRGHPAPAQVAASANAIVVLTRMDPCYLRSLHIFRRSARAESGWELHLTECVPASFTLLGQCAGTTADVFGAALVSSVPGLSGEHTTYFTFDATAPAWVSRPPQCIVRARASTGAMPMKATMCFSDGLALQSAAGALVTHEGDMVIDHRRALGGRSGGTNVVGAADISGLGLLLVLESSPGTMKRLILVQTPDQRSMSFMSEDRCAWMAAVVRGKAARAARLPAASHAAAAPSACTSSPPKRTRRAGS